MQGGGGGGGGAVDNLGAAAADAPRPSRYESQKRRDWHTFGQYLRNHRPPLELARCSGAHVLEFLRYLDQFGKTKGHYFIPHPHFMHGHFLVPGDAEAVTTTANGDSTGGANGDEMAVAMAAVAEAHAAGCMLPLSVFN
ncbi:hypothetical protein ABZP36_021450 [Zizania latifolia]